MVFLLLFYGQLLGFLCVCVRCIMSVWEVHQPLFVRDRYDPWAFSE